jgi:hypothetical protein
MLGICSCEVLLAIFLLLQEALAKLAAAMQVLAVLEPHCIGHPLRLML